VSTFKPFSGYSAIVLADSGLKGVQPRIGEPWEIRRAIQAGLILSRHSIAHANEGGKISV